MAFVENLAPFTTDFGIDAVIGGDTVRAIFDNAYQDVLFAAGTAPALHCATADVANVDRGDSVDIEGDAYTVAEIKPDGTGMSVLILEAV